MGSPGTNPNSALAKELEREVVSLRGEVGDIRQEVKEMKTLIDGLTRSVNALVDQRRVIYSIGRRGSAQTQGAPSSSNPKPAEASADPVLLRTVAARDQMMVANDLVKRLERIPSDEEISRVVEDVRAFLRYLDPAFPAFSGVTPVSLRKSDFRSKLVDVIYLVAVHGIGGMRA